MLMKYIVTNAVLAQGKHFWEGLAWTLKGIVRRGLVEHLPLVNSGWVVKVNLLLVRQILLSHVCENLVNFLVLHVVFFSSPFWSET